MSLINDALKRARQAPKRPAISPSADGVWAVPPPLQPVEDTEREKSQRLLATIPVLLLALGVSLWFLWRGKHTDAKTPLADTQLESTAIQAAAPVKTNALAIARVTATKWQERQQSIEMESSAATPTLAQPEARTATGPGTAGVPANVQQSTLNASSIGALAPGASSVAVPGSGGWSPNVAVENATTASNPSVVSSSVAPTSTPSAIPVTGTESVSLPKLQGIFFRLKRPTALIDGRSVSLGDEINGYRVTRIERESVKLVAAGRTNILALH